MLVNRISNRWPMLLSVAIDFFVYSLLLLLFERVLCLVLIYYTVNSALSSFSIILMVKR